MFVFCSGIAIDCHRVIKILCKGLKIQLSEKNVHLGGQFGFSRKTVMHHKL